MSEAKNGCPQEGFLAKHGKLGHSGKEEKGKIGGNFTGYKKGEVERISDWAESPRETLVTLTRGSVTYHNMGAAWTAHRGFVEDGQWDGSFQKGKKGSGRGGTGLIYENVPPAESRDVSKETMRR